MGIALAPLAAPLLLAGTAVSGFGAIMTGREQARAAEYEQQQYAAQAQTERTAAAQVEARRREELVAALGTIQTIRAGRGVGMSSPTGMAILNSTASEQTRDALQERMNLLGKADQSRIASSMAGSKARYSMISGYVNAGSAALGNAYSYSTLRV